MTDLIYKVENSVAWITINREKQRNTISAEAIRLFLESLDQAEKDDTVRAVCVTGVGDKVFCSGADLGTAVSEDGNQQTFENYANLLIRLSRFLKPTVARINGHCLAGGTGFMLACDIVIARDDVTFGTPEVNVGLFPMMIGALIFRNVPRKKAMEMILLGEKLTAVQARDMGMVTRIVPPENLDDEVNRILSSLASKSPLGMKIGKEAFHAAEAMPFENAVRFLSGKLGEVASTQDAKEGITAFIEKRKPVFRGE